MAGEMKKFVQTVLQETIKTNYPHMALPALVVATVTSVTELGIGGYEYSLRILDTAGEPDPNFPEIPGVWARLLLTAGQSVAVGLLYGALTPVILGEVET